MKSIRMGTVVIAIVATATTLWAAAPDGQFVDLKNDTVMDAKTSLIWQRQALNVTYGLDAAAEYCSKLSLGGLSSGWRLPKRLELDSLVDFRAASPGPTIDLAAFPSTTSGGFWTATTFEVCEVWDVDGTCYTQQIYGYLVNFSDGSEAVENRTNSHYFRCVHDP